MSSRNDYPPAHSCECAFQVAGLLCEDIVAALREGIEEVIAGRLSRQEWYAGARARLIKAGLWREEGEKGGKVKFDEPSADEDGLDPGFAYNPGIPGSRAAALQRLAEEKAARAEQRAARRAAAAQARAAKKAARDAQRAASAEAEAKREAKEQTTMQPQPAPEPPAPLPAAPKTPEAAPATPEAKPKIAAAIPGQPTYADLGLPKLKDVPEELRLPAPELLSAAPTREEALSVFARELGVSAETPLRWIETKIPVPNLSVIGIDYSDLPHIVQKEQDARERFARFVLATITDPFEVWETEYDDGTTRPRLIGLFQGKRQIVVIVRINPNGSKLYNILNAGDDRLDKLRVGRLLYGRLKM